MVVLLPASRATLGAPLAWAKRQERKLWQSPFLTQASWAERAGPRSKRWFSPRSLVLGLMDAAFWAMGCSHSGKLPEMGAHLRRPIKADTCSDSYRPPIRLKRPLRDSVSVGFKRNGIRSVELGGGHVSVSKRL